MNDPTVKSVRPKKGRKVLPALCNLLGTLILVLVIVACLPMVVPQAMGYQVYNIVSGSMAPAIPIGSVIFVERVEATEVQPDDVIAFYSGNSVITHRVVSNQVVEGTFITKGDANETEDLAPIPYSMLAGRVVKHYPVLGLVMEILTTTAGKVYALLFAACGAMLNMLAGRMRAYNKARSE